MSAFDLLAGALLLLSGFLAVYLKNAVHAALALATNFVVMGTVYMVLQARFLGWVQIIVYAGAIMVLFVFVIMLLYAAEAEVGVDPLPWLKPAAAGVALVGFLALAYAFSAAKSALGAKAAAALLKGGTAAALGPELWVHWRYPVLLVAALLFVATVAAVTLIRPGGGEKA